MFWLFLTILVIVAGIAIRKRNSSAPISADPWEPVPSDDEPLDIDEIRRAEAEWELEEGWEGPPEEEEEWR